MYVLTHSWPHFPSAVFFGKRRLRTHCIFFEGQRGAEGMAPGQLSGLKVALVAVSKGNTPCRQGVSAELSSLQNRAVWFPICSLAIRGEKKKRVFKILLVLHLFEIILEGGKGGWLTHFIALNISGCFLRVQKSLFFGSIQAHTLLSLEFFAVFCCPQLAET